MSETTIGSFAMRLEGLALAINLARADGKHTGPWVIKWLFDHKPDISQMIATLQLHDIANDIEIMPLEESDFSIETVPDIDWLEACYKQFEPFSVGPFFLYGSHYEGSHENNKIPLQIDAASAFGSGEHGTTKGCLKALTVLKEKEDPAPKNILDLGTGSGILAIAAHKLWNDVRITGTDIDPESIRVSKNHAGINDTAAIEFFVSDGMNSQKLSKISPFNLIIANILAGPLIEMAPGICDAVADGGTVILSGLLHDQKNMVLSAFEADGMVLKQDFPEEEWLTLMLKKSG